jgi:CheY-like chemotaxis protein
MNGPEEQSSQRILIVDDSRASLYLLSYILTFEGYRIIECHDGESAVTAAGANAPDLVLMNINLPGIDGLTATGRILDRVAPVKIPVIAVSSNKSEEDRRSAFRAGCVACIEKPFERTMLVKAVSSILTGPLSFPSRTSPGKT